MNPVFQNIRVGKKYHLKNYGESTRFMVLRRISDTNFFVKNLLSLESFELEELIRYGKGSDFEIREIG